MEVYAAAVPLTLFELAKWPGGLSAFCEHEARTQHGCLDDMPVMRFVPVSTCLPGAVMCRLCCSSLLIARLRRGAAAFCAGESGAVLMLVRGADRALRVQLNTEELPPAAANGPAVSKSGNASVCALPDLKTPGFMAELLRNGSFTMAYPGLRRHAMGDSSRVHLLDPAG